MPCWQEKAIAEQLLRQIDASTLRARSKLPLPLALVKTHLSSETDCVHVSTATCLLHYPQASNTCTHNADDAYRHCRTICLSFYTLCFSIIPTSLNLFMGLTVIELILSPLLDGTLKCPYGQCRQRLAQQTDCCLRVCSVMTCKKATKAQDLSHGNVPPERFPFLRASFFVLALCNMYVALKPYVFLPDLLGYTARSWYSITFQDQGMQGVLW